jgi:hypothetical protein
MRLFDAPTRSACFVALTAIAVLRGCSCGHGNPGRDLHWNCSTEGRRPTASESCTGSKRYVRGVCEASRCDDGEAGKCCPGTFCMPDGSCMVPPRAAKSCTSDDVCAAGQRCLQRPLVSDNKTCGFAPIDKTGACPTGTQPFNHRCVNKAPCNGGCGANRVCDIDTNLCEDRPPVAEGVDDGCSQACAPGSMLVYSDPDLMLFDQCCAVRCNCERFPALDPGAWGSYSDSVLDGDTIWVSGYNETFGDLMAGRFDRATLRLAALDFVDGVPSEGTLVGDTSGPRHGLDTPGANVGTHTSIALQQEHAPRITYYDLDNRSLKYAAYHADTATWTVSLIDDGRGATKADKGDVGRYSSLLIDSRGIAHVTYYAHRITVNGELLTGPMYARAKNTQPAGYDDWERVMIEPVHACGACDNGGVCVLEQGVPTCKPPASACTGCSCGEVCVNSGGPVCRTSLPITLVEPTGTTPGARDVPVGVGLFTSLKLGAGQIPMVVYYDRFRQHLRAGVANFAVDGNVSTGFDARAVACLPKEDVGRHATLAVTQDGVAIAYQGQGGETLWACQGTTPFDCATGAQLVDDGARNGSGHMVGAYASLDVSAGGQLYVAYADQTDNDVLLATKDVDNLWHATKAVAPGMLGSFTRLHIRGGQAFVSSFLRDHHIPGASHPTVSAVELATVR